MKAARLAVLEALQEPRYRQLWLAGLCVNTARWLDFLVLGWLALELTDSPLMVGLAAFCRAAPMMALGPVAGLLADRFDQHIRSPRGWRLARRPRWVQGTETRQAPRRRRDVIPWRPA